METLIPPHTLREQGIQALREGSLDSACDLLERAAGADAQDAEILAFLGVVYSQQGRHAEAKRTLQQAIALQPREPRFQYNLGVALEDAGDATGAGAAFHEVLKLYPAHPQARARLNILKARSAEPWTTPGAAPPTAPWLQPSYRPASGEDLPLEGRTSAALPMSVGEAFARRAAATLFDTAALTVISFVVSYLIGFAVSFPVAVIGGPDAVRGIVPLLTTLGLLASLVIAWFYAVLPLGRYGQTIGRMLLGIRVVGPAGGSPGLWKAVLREIIGKFLSDFLLIGYLWMLWDPRQQTWHDKIAGTRVERACSPWAGGRR
jgi:uncharacterized RDD family membrane protein YckC